VFFFGFVRKGEVAEAFPIPVWSSDLQKRDEANAITNSGICFWRNRLQDVMKK
jgi:hypothetical protein